MLEAENVWRLLNERVVNNIKDFLFASHAARRTSITTLTERLQ